MLELKKIKRRYGKGVYAQDALKGVSLKFRKREFVAILGPSGCGKTTLLNIIGGLDHYDSGDLLISNRSTKKFKEQDYDAYRNNSIGFIFQNYNLIPHISVLANVEMGMKLSGISKKHCNKAKEILIRVGLKNQLYKKPNELSGGQMQRVAIARALANNPSILLADEPTGALDSKSSIQIMEILKDISQEKLVIMVTHNPSLAKNYATRIIKMQDGEVLEDSNPIDETEKEEIEYKTKQTSMHFKEALNLSLNNIRTKKCRTFLTSFASSVGIIGIAIILSLSNGFNKQISVFEKSTVSSMPIIISEINSEEEKIDSEDTTSAYPNTQYVLSQKTVKKEVGHKNKITKDFIQYIENVNPEIVREISYQYLTNFNLINKVEGKVKRINFENEMVMLPKNLKENRSVLEKKYDILAGREAKEQNEIVLVVDKYNYVTEDILLNLGFTSGKEMVSFDEILNQEIKLILNDDFYVRVGNYFTLNTDLEDLYTSENAISLKIVGIIRLKEDFYSETQSSYFMYTEKLREYVLTQNKDSQIVKVQNNVEYNVLTGEIFEENEDENSSKKQILAYLGEESLPLMIQIHSNNFEQKKELLNYLDKYNEGKEKEYQISYIDQAKLMTSLSENVMDSVTIILVAFSGISLFVSSIMIGIILYISVLERTKEIGILRSLGARRKDIKRVFNAEAFLIGLSSGILGILMTIFLLIPMNQILYYFTKIKKLAILNPTHAIILILVSITLTLIGGTLPAKIASKKNPVVALRTE